MILRSVASCAALVLTLACPAAAPAPDPADEEPPTPSKGRITVVGTLTDEGVECQAMRGDDGELYTLGGNLEGYHTGDRVKVTGEVAEMSFCMQGTTITVVTIERAPDKDGQ
jgi:hypothetical protein